MHLTTRALTQPSDVSVLQNHTSRETKQCNSTSNSAAAVLTRVGGENNAGAGGVNLTILVERQVDPWKTSVSSLQCVPRPQTLQEPWPTKLKGSTRTDAMDSNNTKSPVQYRPAHCPASGYTYVSRELGCRFSYLALNRGSCLRAHVMPGGEVRTGQI
jgi:hypothetical protein